MKTIINAKAVNVLGRESTQGLVIEIDMSERQMYEALNQFLHFITDEEWTKWQRQINGEIYGATDADRYQFLRDRFALNSDNDCAEFARLANLTGEEFDAAVDAAMALDKVQA